MNREALKARHVDAVEQSELCATSVLWKPIHFAPSALRHMRIASPGPLGRAITSRAFSAQNNTMRITGVLSQVC
jgi:hypothetical protein